MDCRRRGREKKRNRIHRESHYLIGVKDTESEKERDGGRDGGWRQK